jgi:nitric oxide synthase-interacting protein
MKKEAEAEVAKAKLAARERVLADFEKGQLFANPAAGTTKSGADSQERTFLSASYSDLLTLRESARGTKRKFAFDSSAVENLAEEAEEAALLQIEREQAEALRAKLPDFWLPSLTPTYTSSGPPKSLDDVKLQTTCRGGNPPHPIA